jgi:ketosteroid isomerase-like protein
VSDGQQNVIDRFFAAYANRDMEAPGAVLAADATWTFPGRHRLSGTYIGVAAIVDFFDAMGAVLAVADPLIERLAQGASERHLVECQAIRTNRPDGSNLNPRLAVLWTLDGGVIRAGQHLAADQDALDAFFGAAEPSGSD